MPVQILDNLALLDHRIDNARLFALYLQRNLSVLPETPRDIELAKITSVDLRHNLILVVKILHGNLLRHLYTIINTIYCTRIVVFIDIKLIQVTL